MTNLDRKMEHGTDRMHALFAFEDSVILATNIERLMAEQNYDKKKFAEVAGITRPTLLKLLRGEGDVKLSTIRKAASALGVSICELFSYPPAVASSRKHL